MKHNTKPFKTHEEQVQLLMQRGLVVSDVNEAVGVLRTVNYYRFTGYAIPFLTDREHFRSGVCFDDIMSAYRYDRKLRDLLFEAAEAVEIDFRARFAYAFSRKYGALGYRDMGNFTDQGKFLDILKNIDSEFDRSKERCVEHFKTQYFQGEVPIWALVEVLSFGTLAKLYNILEEQGQRDISRAYGIKWDILGSYIWHMSVIRNLCAHHARLFDRKFYKFRPLNEWRKLRPSISDTRSVFHQCALAYRLLRNVSCNCFDCDEWRNRLLTHFRSAPQFPCANIKAIMGVPANAETSPLWV